MERWGWDTDKESWRWQNDTQFSQSEENERASLHCRPRVGTSEPFQPSKPLLCFKEGQNSTTRVEPACGLKTSKNDNRWTHKRLGDGALSSRRSNIPICPETTTPTPTSFLSQKMAVKSGERCQDQRLAPSSSRSTGDAWTLAAGKVAAVDTLAEKVLRFWD